MKQNKEYRRILKREISSLKVLHNTYYFLQDRDFRSDKPIYGKASQYIYDHVINRYGGQVAGLFLHAEFGELERVLLEDAEETKAK